MTTTPDLDERARSLYAWDARIRLLEHHDRVTAELATMTEVARSNRRVTRGYAEELDKALRLIAEYVEDEPCDIDHNGYCQAHGLSSTRVGGCRNVRAQRLLAVNSADDTTTGNEE